jgi:hypothetical protein
MVTISKYRGVMVQTLDDTVITGVLRHCDIHNTINYTNSSAVLKLQNRYANTLNMWQVVDRIIAEPLFCCEYEVE